MSSPIAFASIELSYPLYEAEFDPYNRGYLVVSGGGGESRSGVPNKLTLVDVSSRAVIEAVGDTDLPTTEDCPTCTASLATQEGLTVLVNASSGVAARRVGQNNHLRSFSIKFPSKTKAQEARLSDAEKLELQPRGQFESLSRTQLLSTPAVTGNYAYQNPVKLSPVKFRDTRSRRIGAVASRDADVSEITVFDATSLPVDSSAVRQRITPQNGHDAEDLDLIEPSEGTFGLGYCTSSAAFVQNFEYSFSSSTYKAKNDDPIRVYSLPATRRYHKLRGVRWLSQDHIILLSTSNQRKVTELLIVHADVSNSSGRVLQRRSLPKAMKSCATMDVCRLDADPGKGAYQVAVAVGGSNGSIQIYYLDYNPYMQDPVKQIGGLRSFTTLDRVHDNSVCKVAFSPFFAPKQPSNSPVSIAGTKQYIRLVSLGIMSQKVVVESITLTSTPTSPSKAQDVKTKPDTPSVRWVISTTSAETMFTWLSLVLIGVVVVCLGVVYQWRISGTGGDALAPLRPFKFFDAPGAAPLSVRRSSASSKMHETVTAVNRVEDEGTKQVREAVEKAEQAVPAAEANNAKATSLRELVETHGSASESGPGTDEQSGVKKVVLVGPHDEDEDAVAIMVKESGHEAIERAKKFGDLAEDEQHMWKERLKRTGHWLENEGVAVLEGVFFSEFAADVGGALRDAVLNN